MADKAAILRSNSVAAYILFAVVAAAPLPFGSTDPTAVAFWCIVLGVGLIFSNPRGFSPRHMIVLALVALLIAAYGVVLHEQLSSHPWFAVAAPHPVWAEASAVLHKTLQPSVSIARNQPLFSLGAPLAAMLSLLVSFIVCCERSRAKQLLQVIAWSGVAYAVYGVFAHLLDPTHILWREKQAYLSALTSTFVGRNAAAVYFGSCSVIWSILLYERILHHLPPGRIEWRRLGNRLMSKTRSDLLIAFSMLFVCLAAMFMTGSRAGVILSLLAIMLGFILFFRRDLPARSGLIVALTAGGGIALILLQTMGAGVSARIDVQGLSDIGRLSTYRATLRMIADHPWLGTGLGTFAWSYPAYRTADISLSGTWDRAHNTLLEIAADLGLPLAACILVAWIVVLAVLIHGIKVRRRNSAVQISALAVTAIALLHSLVDFSLQIPGYAIVVFALVGAGMTQSLQRNEEPRDQTSK